jgi:multidrug efflux pump subunit AcrA (membrane-fusion protein)
MKLIKIIIGSIMVLLIGLGIAAFVKTGGFTSSSGSGDDDDESAPGNVTNIVTVQVAALTNITLHHYVDGYGTVDAAPATTNEPAAGGALAAPTAGVVSKVNVVAGQQVQKGDVLAELNSSTATFDYAKEEVGRQEKLFASQNTSLKNMQDAKAQLASLEIIAPVSGTVTTLNVKPGQAVDSTAIVAEVIDLNHLAVIAKIPSAQAAELQPGQEVQILTDPPVTASLSFVSPSVSQGDGTVDVWASLPPGNPLRPGQFVQFKIVSAVHTNCLAAPAAGVTTDDSGNSFVSLVNNHMSAQTQVQAGFREGDWVEVNSPGLKEGDQIVTVGAYGLADKTQLKIINPAEETSTTNSADAK